MDVPGAERSAVAGVHAARRTTRRSSDRGEPAHRTAGRRCERHGARRNRQRDSVRRVGGGAEHHGGHTQRGRLRDRVALRRCPARRLEPQLRRRRCGGERRDRSGRPERPGVFLLQRHDPLPGRHRGMVLRWDRHAGVRRHDAAARRRHPQRDRRPEAAHRARRHHDRADGRPRGPVVRTAPRPRSRPTPPRSPSTSPPSSRRTRASSPCGRAARRCPRRRT